VKLRIIFLLGVYNQCPMKWNLLRDKPLFSKAQKGLRAGKLY